jgi:hypothetical protein
MTLSSISHKHGFQVVARVMLERPRDYKQELVELGCKPDDLGTVTWNHVTHAVDVSGSVHLHSKDFTRLPFQFGKVGGDFWCDHNQLTNLEGAPKEVGMSFYCSNNRLTNLDGAPEKVGGGFDCSYNRLTSLEGAPEKVGGGFDCSYNQLTSLEGAPENVGRSFYCSCNRLTSLEGRPEKVGGDFGCSADGLTDVSALRRCKIKGEIYLYGPKADQVRVRKLLMASWFKGEIR